jgi:signal transduction histidine kinase/response regulator of citrate/malate metabolism
VTLHAVARGVVVGSSSGLRTGRLGTICAQAFLVLKAPAQDNFRHFATLLGKRLRLIMDRNASLPLLRFANRESGEEVHEASSTVQPSFAVETGEARRSHLVRRRVLLAAFVLLLTLAVMVSTTFLVGSVERRSMEQTLQRRADTIGQSIDLKLSTYHAALQTVAQLSALQEEFDLRVIERLARRVGALFGGWFVVATGGDTLDVLMSTAREDGALPPPVPRTALPEVMRAEAESLQSGRVAVSDAFLGNASGKPVITLASAIGSPMAAGAFIYFSVPLDDITAWLEQADLGDGEFAVIADGSRRVIARSENNADFLLAALPDWYIAFSEGRDSGVAVGPPLYGGAPRLFAMHRLELAPAWTVAVSRPLPSAWSVASRSAWPTLSGLIVLLLGGSIAGLLLDRSQARAESVRSAREAAERERLLDEVRAADSRKSRLMAVLAHDLRTPLIGLLGTLDMLRNEKEDAVRHRMFQRLGDDGHGMLQLVDDVLELARLGAGEVRLRPEPFELHELLQQVADIVRPQAELNETEVKVQAESGPALNGDVMALRRVLLNFATNAVKATRGGSILLSATQDGSSANGQTVTFAVTDTGRGIAAEDVPRLFRDFGMLERDDPTVEGTGLGLAICRRLATAMGGEVGVESALGKGSRFWLRLTLPVAEHAPPVSDDVQGAPIDILAGMRVLVAEDHPLIRQVTCEQLARVGMVPTAAEDGDIAVTLTESEEFDLILMDIQMPRLDGNKAAVRIRRGAGLSAQARIIGLTAHQSPEIAVMLSELAFDACLRKPLDIAQLADLLRHNSSRLLASTGSEDFDVAQLDQLRKIDGGALLARTLKGFSAEIAAVRTELATQVAARAFNKAARLAHKLIGFSDMLGARKLSAELRIFEDLIDDEEPDALDRALERLDGVMIRAKAQVDRLAQDTTP